MLTDLRINNHNLHDAVEWLVINDFLISTDYSHRENDKYSRRYYIPDED